MASIISSPSSCLRRSVVKEKDRDYTFCPSKEISRRFLRASGHTSIFSKQPSLSLSPCFRVFSSDKTETPTVRFKWAGEDWEKEGGVVGIYGEPEAFLLCRRALSALQHRGQDGAGIATFHNNSLQSITGAGLVSDVFKNSTTAPPPPGTSAIGHVRYSRATEQPGIAGYRGGVAYTGNISNHSALRDRLESLGCIFSTLSDVEVVLHLMDMGKSSKSSIAERLILACQELKGAYSMVILTEGKLVAVRDPLGFRPLVMGRRSNGAVVFASETYALDVVDAHYERREVNPGEALVVDAEGVRSFFIALPPPPSGGRSKACVFEHIYSSFPSSVVSGRSVSEFRHALGEMLATESPVECDVVIALTDSGAIPARGYASKAGAPLFPDVLLKEMGPTFNDPPPKIRRDVMTMGPFQCPPKLKAALEGKRVVVVDDSIARAMFRSSLMLKLLEDSGAKQVHLRIACPPINGYCYYGVHVPCNLIPSAEKLQDYLGYQSVAFLSLHKLREFLGEEAASCFCDGCFSGNYPLIPESVNSATT